jgi:tetratricopeptide (TPR) repeat protein
MKYNPINEGPYREIGYLKMVQEKYQEAVPYLRKAIALCPENYNAYTFLGEIYLRQKLYDSSAYYFQKAVDYKVNMSYAWEGLGTIASYKNDHYTAKTKFIRSMEYGNQNVNLFFNLGRTYEMLSYPDSALMYYNYCTQINPNFPYSYRAMGDILTKQGNTQAAEQYLAKARALGL